MMALPLFAVCNWVHDWRYDNLFCYPCAVDSAGCHKLRPVLARYEIELWHSVAGKPPDVTDSHLIILEEMKTWHVTGPPELGR